MNIQALNETKSSLRTEDLRIFAEETLPTARNYFAEYSSHKILGAIGTLYLDDSMRRYGERLGLIMLGFGEDVMDVLNSPGFEPKEF